MPKPQKPPPRPTLKLGQALDRELTWAQGGSWGRRHALRAGDDLVATLWRPKPFGSLAVGETLEGRWTFKRSGFLHPKVTVRVEGSEQDMAVVEMAWSGGGRVQIATTAERYRWWCSDFWRMKWALGREEGPPLITIATKFALKMKAKVTIDAPARRVKELPMLVLLSWYLMVLTSEDSAAAAGAGAG